MEGESKIRVAIINMKKGRKVTQRGSGGQIREGRKSDGGIIRGGRR